jgi:type VI secretion system secreted protein Hcp
MSRQLVASAFACAFAFTTTSAIAAVDAYLVIDGVQGESKAHPGGIEIESFQWGVGRGISSPTGASSDREARTPSVQEIVITKETDAASPKLFMAAQAGRHFRTVHLYVRKAGGEQEAYVFDDAMVSSVQSNGRGESFTLSYSRMEPVRSGTSEGDRRPGAMRPGMMEQGRP